MQEPTPSPLLVKAAWSDRAPASTTSSFAYGLLVGQLSVIVILALFIRFFVFSDSTVRKDYASRRDSKRNSHLGRTHTDINTILEKTYYDVKNHAPESVDWFTVLVAQAFSQFRSDARANDNLLRSLDTVLNGPNKPDYVDYIRVTELNIGDDFPIFSSCRILYEGGGILPGGSDGLEAQIDVDLTDTLTLAIETRVLLNYPKPFFAVLPGSLSVSIVRFSGTLSVSIRSQPVVGPNGVANPTEGATDDSSAGPDAKTYLTMSFAPDYRLEFKIENLLGGRSLLKNVPKISQMVEYQLRKWFNDRCVSPRYQQIPLPSFWPRTKTTKEATPGASTTVPTTSTPSTSASQPAAPSPLLAPQVAPPVSPLISAVNSQSLRRRRPSHLDVH